MTVSYWTQSLAPTVRPGVDVLVVGAGICGVAAALALQRRGLAVEVLERGTLGCGASSRNAGFLMRGAAENYAAASRQYGRDTARTLWRWTEENLDGLRREGLESLPSYRDIPSCLLALESRELAELRESLAMLRGDGFAVEWLDRGDDAAWRSGRFPALGGLLNPGDASVNPVEMMRRLAAKLECPPREGCEVASIELHAGRVRLVTNQGTFPASRVLVCTNAYAGLLLPSLAGAVTPRRGQMIAIRHTGLRLDASYYVNHGYEYFRQTPDGVIVVGGCRKRFADAEYGHEDRTTPEVQGAIEDFAAAMFGIERPFLNIIARWAGTMGFSPDGLPLIGPVIGDWEPGSVWFCGGFTGHGMSMAWRCAAAAVGAMLDGDTTPFPLSRIHEDPARRT